MVTNHDGKWRKLRASLFSDEASNGVEGVAKRLSYARLGTRSAMVTTVRGMDVGRSQINLKTIGFSTRPQLDLLGIWLVGPASDDYGSAKANEAKRHKALGWLKRFGSLIDMVSDSIELRKPSKFKIKWYTFV
ncbi:hypothetical protein GQ457_15G020840 [Hibiscus cannabinus]